MRWEKVWAIARKEFSEYRKNKYILYSLVVMPVIMAVVLPMVYLLPVSMVGHTSQDPINLDLHIVQVVSNVTLQQTSGQDLRLINVTVVGSSFFGCELIDCDVKNSVLTNCSFNRRMITYSALNTCNVYNTTVDSTVLLTNSVVVGQQGTAQQLYAFLINILLIFFALMPTVIPTIIASYTIVGEKVSRSLEPLLATPLTDEELLAGKAFSILLPSIVVVWAVFVPFCIIVDVIAGPALGYAPMPDALWLVVVFLLGPVISTLAILCNVMISARINDIRSAQQIGGLVVLPVVAFLLVAILGIIPLTPANILIFTIVLATADVGLFFLARKVFRREEILVRWK
jgi:ABC-2 type transport system permease protein